MNTRVHIQAWSRRAFLALAIGLIWLALAGSLARPSAGVAPAAAGAPIFVPLANRPAPPPDDRPDNVRFAVIGDYGSGSEHAVSALVKSWNPGFIVTVGDNNYASDKAASIDARIGQFYAEYIYPYVGIYSSGADSNRFYPVLGNHDWDEAGLEAYQSYFVLPGAERYYDVVRGPVHFFLLDSDKREPDGVALDSIQGRWLQGALASSQSCWDLVILHHAPFSSGEHGSNVWMQWPFGAWGADAVLTGHDHHYERFDIGGLPYFVNGLGGESRYSVGTPVAGSLVRYNDEYGAMLVEATRTSATYQFVAVDGTVVDAYTQSGGCGI
jgi:tartrate-resistant acid phosphatase type 5